MADRRIERFQCVMPYPTPKDPQVQLFVQKLVEGEQLGALIEHQVPLSKFLNPFDLINMEFLEKIQGNVASVPSASGLVPVDHNSLPYKEADASLRELETALQGANDEDDKRAATEISAARRLLQSTRVRIGALVTVVAPALRYLMKKGLDAGIGKLAGIAWDKLIALVGTIPWP
jgi:hypothetical protein